MRKEIGAKPRRKEMEQQKEELLFEIQEEITQTQYITASKKCIKLFEPFSLGVALVFLLSGIVVLIRSKTVAVFFGLGVLEVCMFALILVLRQIIQPKRLKAAYQILQNNGECHSIYRFYDHYVCRGNVTGMTKIPYEQIGVIKEAKDLLILYVPINKVLIIEKEKCSEQQLTFIRNSLSEESKRKYQKSSRNYYCKLSVVLVLLIFLTCFIWFAY